MIMDEEEYLAHYGILRRSGRYPWGSGSTQNVRNKMFLDHVEDLRKSGMSEVEIARGFGITTTQLRAAKSIAKNQQRASDIAMAQRLKAKGYSNGKIAERMGLPGESSVRALLEPSVKDRVDVLEATANMLKDQVEQKGMIDIGSGVETTLGIAGSKLNTAVARLEEEGYKVRYVKVEQLGTGKMTTHKVLVPPGMPYSEVHRNRFNIRQIDERSFDGGHTYEGIRPPVSIKSKRVGIRYAEDGGTDADGVIYVRPGVEDVSLGKSRYAQVRIAVDGTHYLKGMAMYKDDLPDGVDLVFNTNKHKTGDPHDAMKPMNRDKDGNIDMENPFGAVIKPGGQRGVMNIVNEEGDWGEWSRSLSSQMLSKQSPSLAKGQLDMLYERKKNNLDEIMELSNPAVRRKLLEDAAGDLDSSAVHLKAAALPRQATQVILPINSLKENEIYAPNFRNGETVVLVRHPHGGVFEIPELRVNNNHPEAKKLLKNASDAVGINSKVAEKLSGADFDGDNVLVIPNNSRKVKSAPSLEGLKDFNPKEEYAPYDGMKTIDGGTWNAKTKEVEYGPKGPSGRPMQIQMGVVSNLITDMTIRGASSDELARAVRHSMVVIDSQKHHLNVQESAKVNGIQALKAKYQTTPDKTSLGASTLISRASSEVRVPERTPRKAKDGGPIDKETGKKVFIPTGASYVDSKGRVVPKTEKSKKLAETEDAHTLSSGTVIEKIYADHSNRLKTLANEARKAAVNTKSTPYSPSAKKVYANEVKSLDHKLQMALRNRPLERQAQLIANAQVQMKRQANPEMEPSDIKKIKAQALAEARARTGAKKTKIVITNEEWNAIQAGAITNHRLTEILRNADMDVVKKHATPKVEVLMTSTKKARAEAMAKSGYTQAEIADALGVSLTTLKNSLT